MTHFLASEANPDGYTLEEILRTIRKDIVARTQKIAGDKRPEAERVLSNNIRILNIITEAIVIAEDSTKTLNKAFGPPTNPETGKPRIGNP